MVKKRLIVIMCIITLIAVTLPTTVVSADTKILDHVVITPISSNLLFGATQQFTARGEDANDEPIEGLTYTWEVVNGGGTIDGNGIFTAGTTEGTFTDTVKVTAEQGTIRVSDFASVTIFESAGPLDHAIISPETVTLPVNGTQEFIAQGQDVNDLPINTGLEYKWEVVNNGGIVTDAGVFTAGTETGNFTDTVQVTVTEGTTSATAFATVIIKSGPNKNKNSFFPWGWLQGLKKGWQGLHFPPGWFKNGKANQADDEVNTASPQGKGNQNQNKNKNKNR